jgi:MarR family transcriptional regulator, transcriptional regulator for hemolysin
MKPPIRPPIGLLLSGTAKHVSRAFDDAMADAGGSMPIWQILLVLKTRQVANQRELAEAVGIQGATLTHHLNAMERDALLTRRRDPVNRRVHVVELTDEGERMFHTLRAVAVAFDKRLRTNLTDHDITVAERVLSKLAENARSAG